MFKYLSFLVILSIGINMANAQDCITGVVKSSETKEPIPFAYILSKDGSLITFADVNGTFCIKDSVADCIIYCMGYDSLLVTKLKLGGVDYYLNPKHYAIGQVEILGTKLKPYSKVLQKVKIWPGQDVIDAYLTQGCIVARFIEGNGARGRIKKVFVYTSEIGEPYSFFRIKLYKNSNGQLGEEITPNNIIAKGAPNKYIEVDVSSLNIAFPPEGLYVGMEIIEAGNKSFEKSWGTKKNITVTYYGPSLGCVNPTRSEKRKWKNEHYYFYNGSLKVWVYGNLPQIPLIAAEVIYFKKKK